MRGHFQSRDKDGCHTIRSAVLENPILLHTNHMALSVIGPKLWAMSPWHSWIIMMMIMIELYIAGIGNDGLTA